MHLTPSRYHVAWDAVLKAVFAGNTECAETVVVFAGTDIDAVCACAILCGILRARWIAHKIVPVGSFPEMQAAARRVLARGTPSRSVFFLNCGGIVDLSQLLQDILPDMPQLHLYVFESRRPLHLSNIFFNEQVTIMDDGHIEDAAFDDIHEAYQSLMFASDEEMDVDDDDKRMEHLRADRERRRRTEHSEGILEQYYGQGDWRGTPIALLMLELSVRATFVTMRNIWYAIVSVVDAYMSEHISLDLYARCFSTLAVHVLAISPAIPSSLQGPLEALLSAPINDGVCADSTDVANVLGMFPGETLFVVNEPKLALHRHWSLYASMRNSAFVVGGLSIWNEHGNSRLLRWLAKVGIPKQEYDRPFIHINKHIKDKALGLLAMQAPAFGIEQEAFFCKSFVKLASGGIVFSAYDAVVALQSQAALVRYHIGYCDPKDLDGSKDSGTSAPTSTLFYTLFDAIASDTHNDHFHYLEGIECAKKLIPEICALASLVIKERLVKTARNFRYVIITDPEHAVVLCPPLFEQVRDEYGLLLKKHVDEWGEPIELAENFNYICSAATTFPLRQLALTVNAVLRNFDGPQLPLLVGVKMPICDKYRILGFAGARENGKIVPGRFSAAFHETCEAHKIFYKHDFFDPELIDVNGSDINDFLEALQYYVRPAV